MGEKSSADFIFQLQNRIMGEEGCGCGLDMNASHDSKFCFSEYE